MKKMCSNYLNRNVIKYVLYIIFSVLVIILLLLLKKREGMRTQRQKANQKYIPTRTLSRSQSPTQQQSLPQGRYPREEPQYTLQQHQAGIRQQGGSRRSQSPTQQQSLPQGRYPRAEPQYNSQTTVDPITRDNLCGTVPSPPPPTVKPYQKFLEERNFN